MAINVSCSNIFQDEMQTKMKDARVEKEDEMNTYLLLPNHKAPTSSLSLCYLK